MVPDTFFCSKAHHDLLYEVREEQKARREVIRGLWLALISAFVGIIGALTGLVAILRK